MAYLAFMFITQSKDLDRISNFPLSYILIIPMLVLLGYTFRALRWEHYLNGVGVKKLAGKEVHLTFFSGLSMAVSPGKFGELIKSYLLKEASGVEYSRTVPVVVAERLTDLIAVLLLACVGIASYWVGIYSVVLLLIIVVVGILALQNRRVFNWLTGVITRMKRFKPYRQDLKAFHRHLRTMLSAKYLATGTGIGLVAWGLEALGLWLIFIGTGLTLSFYDAIFIFSFSSIIGVVSMLPGGIGTMEASMVGVLLWKGLSAPDATFVTLMIRIFTLWFAVILGVIVLQYFTVKFNIDLSKDNGGKRKKGSEEE